MKNKVKSRRSVLHITQDELAKQTGVTRQTIGLIENNKFNPSLTLCIAIAKALNQTLNDLFWEEEL
ncbi:transcriptional regulator [Lysinibacillus sp. 2017]|uniref:helix-turn-helix transcriptional regulator n=1 Tax=unclassified Lysinibacillus TaxID=2636778 RepID=UPI000D5273DE|nr:MULTISPECIES: helix-turn-helix transcriptional regulator [unclassified Lysinibacillus]AWE07809.1 transcriptional regulator [Lysinibacillus sp. 2017]TGN34630.1 transcriptional regulator [Lysinibacillus sp. S2017]